MNRHGDPSRTKGTIEWEGTAEHVAWHPPYILIFDSRFIEVRHVETGRLCQVIPGNDLQCTMYLGWTGSVNAPCRAWTERSLGRSTVARGTRPCVRRVDDTSIGRASPSGATRGVIQHIFELIPTVLPFLPEELASPTQQSSFVHPSLNGSP